MQHYLTIIGLGKARCGSHAHKTDHMCSYTHVKATEMNENASKEVCNIALLIMTEPPAGIPKYPHYTRYPFHLCENASKELCI